MPSKRLIALVRLWQSLKTKNDMSSLAIYNNRSYGGYVKDQFKFELTANKLNPKTGVYHNKTFWKGDSIIQLVREYLALNNCSDVSRIYVVINKKW